MLAIYEDRKDLNLILLDEPDSHIHRDIQKRLVDVLTNYTNNAQVFITTHNESLIRSTKPKNLFHITSTGTNNKVTQCKPVIDSQLPTIRVGMMPTYHTKILRAVGNENALDLVNAIEAHKLILVEGDDDASNLQKILALQNYSKDIVYWAFRGIDTLIQKISHYKDFLNGIGSGISLWDKAIIVIDADYMTQDQQRDFAAGFYAKLNIYTHCWSSYTIESTILTDPNVLKLLIHRIVISIGMVLAEDDIEGAITRTIDEFKTVKLERLANDVVIRSSISAQIATKNKHLTECLNLNRVIQGPASNFFANYELFARQQLNANKISHMCNKDDVEEFCRAVFDKLGVNPMATKSYFQQIVDIADPVVCFEEWRNFFNLVNT